FSFASLLMNPRTPLSTLFPYTTLFRSIFPERDMGQRLAHNLVSPNILDYIELADDYSIAEIKATEKMFGKNLRELNIRAKYGCRSEEHTSELQSRENLVCRLLLEKKKK